MLGQQDTPDDFLSTAGHSESGRSSPLTRQADLPPLPAGPLPPRAAADQGSGEPPSPSGSLNMHEIEGVSGQSLGATDSLALSSPLAGPEVKDAPSGGHGEEQLEIPDEREARFYTMTMEEAHYLFPSRSYTASTLDNFKRVLSRFEAEFGADMTFSFFFETKRIARFLDTRRHLPPTSYVSPSRMLRSLLTYMDNLGARQTPRGEAAYQELALLRKTFEMPPKKSAMLGPRMSHKRKASPVQNGLLPKTDRAERLSAREADDFAPGPAAHHPSQHYDSRGPPSYKGPESRAPPSLSKRRRPGIAAETPANFPQSPAPSGGEGDLEGLMIELESQRLVAQMRKLEWLDKHAGNPAMLELFQQVCK